MKRTYTKEKLLRYKQITLKSTFASLMGYIIPLSTAYLGRFMGFTEVPYTTVHYLGLYVVVSVLLFALIIYMKKEVTPYYSQAISLAQFFNFLIIAVSCFFLLQEIRIAMLTCTLLPLIFLFSVGNFISSVVIVAGLLTAYLTGAYHSNTDLVYGIGFKYDIIICIGFLISSSSMIAMAQQFRTQKKTLRRLRHEAEAAGEEMQQSILGLRKANTTIQSLIAEIADQAVFVSEEAHLVTNAGLSLADDSVKQANVINDVAETMRDISDKTTATTESTVRVDELVAEARTLSGRGVEQMNEMSAAMEEMSTSGKSIFKIIETIDDIAFQTNLLALNAAIEASKAGRHGKGFAVVAQEVRTLAARSADAASITAQLIEQSIQKVEKGTGLSEHSAQALDKINSKISDVAKLVEEIAVATRHQRDDILNVNKVLENISDITDSNTQSARQTGQAAGKLSETATTIQAILNSFN